MLLTGERLWSNSELYFSEGETQSNGKREILYLLTFCSPTQISKEKKDEKKYFDEVTFCLKILFILLLA